MIPLTTAVLRLAIALAFGSIIGVEREWRAKHAGLKTMALVSLGAATFAMLSDTFGPNNHNPGMLAAAVVGGIGFIGAGVIMHRGVTVQGVTTAATLWAAASVGVAVGLGQFAVATVLTGGILVVQSLWRRFEQRILDRRRGREPGRFELRVECEADSLSAVNDRWQSVAEVQVIRESVQRGPEYVVLRVILRAPREVDLTSLEEKLVLLSGVRRVDVTHLGVEEG